MKKTTVSRRNFIQNTSLTAAGIGIMGIASATKPAAKVRIGVIGLGGRGTNLLRNLLLVDDIEIAGLCDLYPEKAQNAAAICTNAGQKPPRIYCNNETTYRQLIDKEKPDAILIATYWDSHAEIAIYAMNRGVRPGIEVPCALTIDDCWNLIETTEKTGVQCMMMENWSFRKDNLALLNMIRNGMFGEIVHGHCAYSHDLVDHWYFDAKTGLDRWHAKYPLLHNRSQYPTHAMGPMMSWMDINCGDVITEIYSMATAPKGIQFYFEDKFGKDHPNANKDFKQGDIVTSLLKTKNGKTIVLNNDVCLPRPYSNRWLIQGTKGVYDEEKASLFLKDYTPKTTWEPFQAYETKYMHKWWESGTRATSHGGTDYVMLREFAEAVRNKRPSPLSIYDGVVMSAIIPLSEMSIAQNRPIAFPDFTKGRWAKLQPYYAL